MTVKLILLWALIFLPQTISGAELSGFSEYSRPDPFGKIVAPDRGKTDDGDSKSMSLLAARNGYASFNLAVELRDGGDYDLSLVLPDADRRIKIDIYKEWFHFNNRDARYYPDALIPVANPYSAALPDADNRIKGQIVQAFWVDLWIPRDAVPGLYHGQVALKTKRKKSTLNFDLRVLPPVIPEEDALAVDHNSYGTFWMAALYPKLKDAQGKDFFSSDALFDLIHSYHQIFYEHHGTFHQLGYGHAGKTGPEFAPTLKGSGKDKHVDDWSVFDRHYGPLLDGSAFAATRRGPKPIPYAYLPVNPEWPASFLWWGEPGYKAEFGNVLGEMEKHFREKGWTHTQYELFFNHKKRYKGFPWDGDEARFAKDDEFFFIYSALLKRAIPPASPVKFVMRADASWRMEDQFKTLGGIVDFWVCSKDILAWLPDALRAVKERGDTVWIYGGAPAISESSSAILADLLRAWVWNVDGYVHWLAVSPSDDPWYHSDGEATCLVYPGEKFGLSRPLPSIRLKIQRNFIQDINLLKLLEKRHSPDELRAEVSSRLGTPQPRDWWTPRPPMANTPPEDWSNDMIEDAAKSAVQIEQKLQGQSWEGVRTYILNTAESETKR